MYDWKKSETNTDTTASFQTSPELTEPVKNFFESLLEQENTETMSASKGANRDIEMKVTTANEGKIAKLNMPKEFNGDRKMFEDFYNTVELYLHVNQNIYKDEDKISFVLSLMTEGDARTWRSQFQANARKTTPYTLGTWDEFMKNLNSAFESFDAPGDALEELKLLRRKDNHIEDQVATFRRLVQAANIPTPSETSSKKLSTPRFSEKCTPVELLMFPRLLKTGINKPSKKITQKKD